MPFIVVHGVSQTLSQSKLKEIKACLQEATAGISELQKTKEQVNVSFPADLLLDWLEEKIAIFIYLYDKPERTPEVLSRLRSSVGGRVKELFFPTSLVTCRTSSIKPEEWWSSKDG